MERYCTSCEEYKDNSLFSKNTIKNGVYICAECVSEYRALRDFNPSRAEYSRKGKPKERTCLRCDKKFKTFGANRICQQCHTIRAFGDEDNSEDYTVHI